MSPLDGFGTVAGGAASSLSDFFLTCCGGEGDLGSGGGGGGGGGGLASRFRGDFLCLDLDGELPLRDDGWPPPLEGASSTGVFGVGGNGSSGREQRSGEAAVAMARSGSGGGVPWRLCGFVGDFSWLTGGTSVVVVVVVVEAFAAASGGDVGGAASAWFGPGIRPLALTGT